MNSELRELYQEVIIDHNANPRNFHELDNATHVANGFNPLCGDKLTVYVNIKNELINDISFKGCGCAISQASASLMTDAIKGRSIKAAHELFHCVHNMLTKENDNELQSLGKLSVLTGVRAFPARVKCATLAWHTLEAALNKDASVVKTE